MPLALAARIALPLLALALLIAPVAVWAEDEAQPTPAERYAAARAAFPAPSARQAMAFQGQVQIADTPVGTYAVKVEVVQADDGAPLYKATEKLEMLGGQFFRTNEVLLDRTLALVAGRAEGKQPDAAAFVVEWKAVDGGFELTRTETGEGAAEPTTVTAKHDGPTISTLGAYALLSRLTFPGAAEYAMTVFSADEPNEAKRFEAATWTVAKDVAFDGRTVWAGSGVKGAGDKLEIFFEPESMEMLGLDLTTAAGRRMQVRPESETDGKEVPDPFAGDAKSAEAAAVRAALGFAVKDLPLVDGVVHWPSVHAFAKAEYDAEHADDPDAEPFLDVEAFRAAAMEGFERSLTERPRPMIEAVLKNQVGNLVKTELETGEVKVAFPAIFQSLELVVREVDGVWYLSRMPDE